MRSLQAPQGILLALLIFSVDCLLPANLLFSLCYIVALLLGPLSRPRDTWIFASTLAVLTLLSPFIGPAATPGAPHWVYWTNRILSAGVILLAALLIERQRASVHQRDQALRTLGEAVRAREVFLASLAHELRNPLAPLRNGVEMLRQTDGKVSPRLAEIMMRQLTHLIRLVDDLLELSRIRGGKISLHYTETPIASLLQTALETEKERLEGKSQNVTVRINATGALFCDDVRLNQVFINLICNASKFTPAGGRIQVAADERGPNIIFSVEDSGKGIPRDLLPKIFNMFEQADVRGEVGGLGIGLALVKEIVEMHNGTITADSEGEGKGATFTLSLPRRPNMNTAS